MEFPHEDPRADVGGVNMEFELETVEEAKRYVADFPMSKAFSFNGTMSPVARPYR